jgi:hypothetical protein
MGLGGHDVDSDMHGLRRREVREAIESAGLASVYVDTAFEIEIECH